MDKRIHISRNEGGVLSFFRTEDTINDVRYCLVSLTEDDIYSLLDVARIDVHKLSARNGSFIERTTSRDDLKKPTNKAYHYVIDKIPDSYMYGLANRLGDCDEGYWMQLDDFFEDTIVKQWHKWSDYLTPPDMEAAGYCPLCNATSEDDAEVSEVECIDELDKTPPEQHRTYECDFCGEQWLEHFKQGTEGSWVFQRWEKQKEGT